MNQGVFWRALGVQTLIVGGLFALLAAIFDREVFKDYGLAIGPIAWLGCSLATAKLLSLPAGLVMFAALAGGVAGFLVGLVAGHVAGLGVSLLVFAASCGGHDAERDAAPA